MVIPSSFVIQGSLLGFVVGSFREPPTPSQPLAAGSSAAPKDVQCQAPYTKATASTFVSIQPLLPCALDLARQSHSKCSWVYPATRVAYVTCVPLPRPHRQNTTSGPARTPSFSPGYKRGLRRCQGAHACYSEEVGHTDVRCAARTRHLTASHGTIASL